MALVVFLRGVNVGGHRTFRPSQLAAQLTHLDAVNIGAAGTFVIRKRISQTKLRAELARRLPFETKIAICDGKDILALVDSSPYKTRSVQPGIVLFVSVRCAPARQAVKRIQLPADGQWLVRVIGGDRRFILGEYRRHMKTIGYLGKLDALIGAPLTTRNWSTINTIAKTLRQTR